MIILKKIKILTQPGCPTCEKLKKKAKTGVEFVSISSKQGKILEQKSGAKLFPECVVVKKDRVEICDIHSFAKKYGINLKD
jgi:glutaredoxin